MTIKVPASGPLPAKIMIVGEAPEAEEERILQPFVGQSGQELTRMLHEAGIPRTECYITNICKHRPPRNQMSLWMLKRKTSPGEGFVRRGSYWIHPLVEEGIEELKNEIALCEPNVIIALGNPALWALTRKDAITKWRGSLLILEPSYTVDYSKGFLIPDVIKVLPTYHPAAILRNWGWRFIAVHDLRWAALEAESPQLKLPEFNFLIRPSFNQVVESLQELIEIATESAPNLTISREETPIPHSEKIVRVRDDLGTHGPDMDAILAINPAPRQYAAPYPISEPTATLNIAADIETVGGQIACVGIAATTRSALCIPFVCKARPEGYWTLEEEIIITKLLAELLQHPSVGVIGQNFAYDAQYFADHWGYVPNLSFDTMVAQGVLYPGLRKGLDFLSSMYCEGHVYWKDEGKEIDGKRDEDEWWEYNCKDACRTLESKIILEKALKSQNLWEQYLYKMAEWEPVLTVMLQGTKIDQEARATMDIELDKAMVERLAWIERVLGHPLNPRSNKQMKALFYDDFKLPVQKARKANAKGLYPPTLNEEALQTLAKKEPLVWPLIDRITEYRSAGVFLSTFVRAKLDPDDRMRSYFNIIGTETMRFSSSKNAFGRGGNFENIPSGDEDEAEEDEWALPNVRKIFIPDEDYIICDADLSKADAQVVAWDADDETLKQIFREGLDLHEENAKAIFGHMSKHNYAMAKRGVHLSNYLGGSRTLSMALGITTHEADRFQRQWFGAHPKILTWQESLRQQLMETRQVTNKFGYRRFYFGRIENEIKEAAAWIPQSTVACVTNRGLVNIYNRLPQIDILNQNHDSLVFQIHKDLIDELLPKATSEMRILVPHDDPLIIPVTVKTSPISWGHAEA